MWFSAKGVVFVWLVAIVQQRNLLAVTLLLPLE